MRLEDSFKLSMNSITHRRLRSWLTLLGIVIGVAAVVAIVSIGEGAQASITEQLSGLGADIITISPGYSQAGSFGGKLRGGVGHGDSGGGGTSSLSSEEITLTNKDAMTILSNHNIDKVNEIVSGKGELIFLSEKISSASIEGVNPNTWPEISNLELESGRFLTASDSTAIVIGNKLANETFNQPITLGRRISIEGQSFTVVGILEASGSSGFSMFGGDSTVYMTHSSAWNITDTNRNEFSSIQAKAKDTEIIAETTEELTASLMLSRKVTEKDQDFTISSAQSIQEQVGSVTDTMTLFLAAIAAVSLVVGAVGVANSMFTSVLEKTREIGILKALGSTNDEILRLFVIESGLFGLIGGIIGVLIGFIGSLIVSTLLSGMGIPMLGRGGISTLVSPGLVIIAIVLSTLIGIASGVFPARAASKLKPVEALRYE